MTVCLELISAYGQVYVTLERGTVLVVSLRKKKNPGEAYLLRTALSKYLRGESPVVFGPSRSSSASVCSAVTVELLPLSNLT